MSRTALKRVKREPYPALVPGVAERLISLDLAVLIHDDKVGDALVEIDVVHGGITDAAQEPA
ncbi:hypothetical protein AB4099_27395 [Bosea sp. 2KB_26]|uniref:hypothetical protein n=1 Tax=Bosea sp. 2KB_26 TaxID=3237475 RepID=UPI003F935364